jgi:hypothetical protein
VQGKGYRSGGIGTTIITNNNAAIPVVDGIILVALVPCHKRFILLTGYILTAIHKESQGVLLHKLTLCVKFVGIE